MKLQEFSVGMPAYVEKSRTLNGQRYNHLVSVEVKSIARKYLKTSDGSEWHEDDGSSPFLSLKGVDKHANCAGFRLFPNTYEVRKRVCQETELVGALLECEKKVTQIRETIEESSDRERPQAYGKVLVEVLLKEGIVSWAEVSMQHTHHLRKLTSEQLDAILAARDIT